jgi:hypothetical protein
MTVIREKDAHQGHNEGDELGTLELELCSTSPGPVERLFEKLTEFVADIGEFHDDDSVLDERFDGVFTHGDMRDLRNILMDVHRTLRSAKYEEEKKDGKAVLLSVKKRGVA